MKASRPKRKYQTLWSAHCHAPNGKAEPSLKSLQQFLLSGHGNQDGCSRIHRAKLSGLNCSSRSWAAPRGLSPFSKHQLAAVKCFGIPAGSIAFHSPEPHERKECVRLKPALLVLGREGFHEKPNLLLVQLRLEGDKHGWPSHITVIL